MRDGGDFGDVTKGSPRHAGVFDKLVVSPRLAGVFDNWQLAESTPNRKATARPKPFSRRFTQMDADENSTQRESGSDSVFPSIVLESFEIFVSETVLDFVLVRNLKSVISNW